jgi:ABC-type glycerol-3-phosphate transport system substrate-binding protein
VPLIRLANNMKYLVCLLILMLTNLLTACSGSSSAPHAQVAPSTTTTSIARPSGTGTDTRLLEDFVNSLNEQQVSAALNSFNEGGEVIENDPQILGTNFSGDGLPTAYTSKGEIEGWLQYQMASNLKITPVEYTVDDNKITLEDVIAYNNHEMTGELVAYTQHDGIDHLFFYIDNIK